jgi:hypothetical protein
MTRSGWSIQTKGSGCPLCRAEEAFDGVLEFDPRVEDAALEQRLPSLAKKPSTALSHEAEVGVKWKVKRGCRSSQARTFGLVGGVVVENDAAPGELVAA